MANLPPAAAPKAAGVDRRWSEFRKSNPPDFREGLLRLPQHPNPGERAGARVDRVHCQGRRHQRAGIEPGNGAESALVLYLKGDKKPRMPLDKDRSACRADCFGRRWIDQLPEEEPQVGLQKAEAAVALAERQLAWARASLPALEARIAADNAKYANPPDPHAEALAEVARKADRQANLLKGERDLFQAQQKLTEALSAKASDDKEDRAREKRVSAASDELENAQAALGVATATYTPVGTLYPADQQRPPAGFGALDCKPEESAHRARCHQRHLAPPFREGHCADGGQFRHERQAADQSSIAGLAGGRVHGKELEHEGHSPPHGHQQHLSDAVFGCRSQRPRICSIDPDNKYLWRMNPQRMEGEEVRDSMLYMAGLLDLTRGGPEIDETKGQESRRRSLYFRQTPDNQMVFLHVFDGADAIECYERSDTVAPQQALALANSKISFTVAGLVAGHLGGETPQPGDIRREGLRNRVGPAALSAGARLQPEIHRAGAGAFPRSREACVAAGRSGR